MAVNNSTILEKMWLNGTNDFQQRVPNPTQAGIKRTIQTIMDPMNQDLWNQFQNFLINRIGTTYVHSDTWDNPLAEFKRTGLTYGNSIQEIVPGWVRAHSYSQDSTLLDTTVPTGAQWFHSINRQDVYPISKNDTLLMRAFDSDYGLNAWLAGIMTAPINSDNYDEYRIMMELIGYYDETWGFYTDVLTADPMSEAGAKELMTKVRAYTGRWKYPSTLYTANIPDINSIPVFARPQDMMLFITPDMEAYMDVNVLAATFHVELADINVRRIVVDEFPVPGMYALLTTSGFYVCQDTVYRNTSFFDPSNLMDNYWLHHQGIYSVSPFVPCVAFKYGAGTSTSVPVVTQTVTGLELAADRTIIKPGESVQLRPTLQGRISNNVADAVMVEPDAATFDVALTQGSGKLNSRTYVDHDFVLHTQKTLSDGDQITVTATSVYVNPSGATTDYTATVAIAIEE